MIRTNAKRKGTVVVAVAVSLVAILGVVALSLDGGLLVDKRRQTQSAADAAALAAASELFASVFTNGGLDNGPIVANPQAPAAGTIAQFAKKVAMENGFEDGTNGVSVQVFIPPQTGPFKGTRGHVEVVISSPQPRHFSRVFGSREDIPVGARAVARGTRTTIGNGIIVLDPVGKGTFSNGGGGNVMVGGSAPVIVNSNHNEAMIANGGGSVTAPVFDVTGQPGWATPGGGSFAGTINSGVEPTPDPLRFVPQPDPSTMRSSGVRRGSRTPARARPRPSPGCTREGSPSAGRASSPSSRGSTT